MTDLAPLLPRIERLLERLETSAASAAPDWNTVHAARWAALSAELKPILRPQATPTLDSLIAIDAQKARVDANTRQFVEGRPANNVLLTGARGCGKSSLVKAVHARYAPAGLRLIEVDKAGLPRLPDLFELLAESAHRFIVFIDDLSFAEHEAGYASLKAALDGSLAGPGDNVLIYATSNRRHLMPEYMAENLETRYIDGEVQPGEASEEKVSLSDRFGIWVSFYAIDQDTYLAIARHWAGALDAPLGDGFERAALQWAQGRGARSGRVAWQFARDWAGRR